MRVLDALHRWTGGILGLVLAVLGLSGMILTWREAWIGVPHAHDPLSRDPAAIAAVADRLMTEAGVRGIVFASDRLGLHQLRMGAGGAYADQSGVVVERWASLWSRPELWLFDLHHHLFAGETGDVVIGIAGIATMLFVVTGSILWWRTRRTYRFRLLPKRMSRTAIVMHHRDLGIVAAPLLLLAGLTGTVMIFKPVAAWLLAPVTSPAVFAAAMAGPKVASGPIAARPDWRGIVTAAQTRFPDADLRQLNAPRKSGDPIVVRMRQPAEWTPNGRTMLSFDAADGRLLDVRDALSMPAAVRIYNMAYPVHAAKVGGMAWQGVTTLTGLALTLLGTLAVWSFWFRRPRQRGRP